MELTISQLAEKLGAKLVGSGSGKVGAVNSVALAQSNEVTFAGSKKFFPLLRQSKAGAVIIVQQIEELRMPQLIVGNVDVALVNALNLFAPKLKDVPEGIDPTAKVGQDAKISKGAYVGPKAVIDDGVEIGKDTIVHSGSKIGQNTKIGESCQIHSNTVIYHNCRLGNNVIIQANSTIGSVGYGYVVIDGKHTLIPHNGGVVIEDCVEIGANCCVDRAKFNNTVIGAGTKIDNLVQIGHNVRIGKCCLIIGQAGIAGSCKLGDGVVLSGQVGVIDNIEIGDGAMIAAKSTVFKSLKAGVKVMGTPAIDSRLELRAAAFRKRLPELSKQLRDLTSRIERLESSKDNKS